MKISNNTEIFGQFSDSPKLGKGAAAFLASPLPRTTLLDDVALIVGSSSPCPQFLRAKRPWGGVEGPGTGAGPVLRSAKTHARSQTVRQTDRQTDRAEHVKRWTDGRTWRREEKKTTVCGLRRICNSNQSLAGVIRCRRQTSGTLASTATVAYTIDVDLTPRLGRHL